MQGEGRGAGGRRGRERKCNQVLNSSTLRQSTVAILPVALYDGKDYQDYFLRSRLTP